MAYYEREYYQDEQRGGFGAKLRLWSVTTWLIIINVTLFIVDGLVGRLTGEYYLAEWGHFSASTAVFGGQVWRFLTFQFLHGGLGHIFFNMLALYFFGPMMESHMGSRRYLLFYLLCGLGGAAAYLLLWGVGILGGGAATPLVGASAGIFGVLIAAARLAPDTKVMMIFPPIPISLRAMAWVMVGIAAFVVVVQGGERGGNAGGEAAHLGGAAVGFLLVRRLNWLNWAQRLGGGGRLSLGKLRRKNEQSRLQKRLQEQAELDREVDRILDKVAHEGMQSLTHKEKKTLQRATELQRRG